MPMKLVESWAATGLYSQLVSRGADGHTPTIEGIVPPETTHHRSCVLFNNPVGLKITSVGGAPRNNPNGFFGTSEQLNPTVATFGNACRLLRRVDVPFFDFWPFVAQGEGVGTDQDMEECRRTCGKLFDALTGEGFIFFLVASSAGWSTLQATLGAGRSVIVPCPVSIFGVEHTVDVLVLKTVTGPCFFVKGKHFSRWTQNREASIASLVCFFEIAGQKLDVQDIRALVSS